MFIALLAALWMEPVRSGRTPGKSDHDLESALSAPWR
jgi:hypothetical protein